MTGSCYLNWEDPRIVTYPGNPQPLGAYYDGHGINFALYSEFATKVYLCLFRPSHDEKHELIEYMRIKIKGNLLIIILKKPFLSNIFSNFCLNSKISFQNKPIKSGIFIYLILNLNRSMLIVLMVLSIHTMVIVLMSTNF
jgi:hypothetical protein